MDLTRFARALAADTSSLRFLMGVVVSIQSNYTVTVTIAGSTSQISAVKYASSVCPRVGSSVYMVTDGSDLWIISQLAPVGSPSPTALRGTNQTLTTAVETAISFSSVVNDGWGSFNLAGNPTRLTAVLPGRYMVTGFVQFASNATGTREIAARVNGTTKYGVDTSLAASGAPTHLSVTTPAFTMAATDYVELTAYQNSGGNLDIVTLTEAPALSLIYLGTAG